MDKFIINSLVIDNKEECAPRKVVMALCEHCNKEIKGLLGTTDNRIIFLTDYNKKGYKPYRSLKGNKSEAFGIAEAETETKEG